MADEAPDISHPAPVNYGSMLARPVIEFVDVKKVLGGRAVLSGLNLVVRAGETLAIIGRSGTGKSTLLKHAVGLLQPDSGVVRIEGVDITRGRPADLDRARLKIGFLFQSAALLNSLTVFENVALPLREHDDIAEAKVAETVMAKLREVGLEHKRDAMPQTLSGGEKKRVGLARALVRDPAILLYDEPTTGLDPEIASQIDELVRAMQKRLKVSSLVVTHDMDTATFVADRIALLHEGKILEEGRPQDMARSSNPIVRTFLSERHRAPESEALVARDGG